MLIIVLTVLDFVSLCPVSISHFQ